MLRNGAGTMRGGGRCHKRAVTPSARTSRMTRGMDASVVQTGAPNTLPTTVPAMPLRAITSCKRSGAAMSVRHNDRRGHETDGASSKRMMTNERGNAMNKWFARLCLATGALVATAGMASAAEVVKVGLIADFTGAFANWGSQFQ